MRKTIYGTLILLTMVLSTGVSCKKGNPVIEIQTPKGVIAVELYVDQAPVTANHFLKLAKEGLLDGGSFYRTVRGVNDPEPIKINVVQGGVQRKPDVPDIQAIAHETTKTTGVRHLDGVISMARSKPGTARAEFFICIGDQPELDFGGRRNPDGQGFAAFGRVIEGEQLVRDIWSAPAIGQQIDPPIRIHQVTVR